MISKGARRMAYVGYVAMASLIAAMGWALYHAEADSRDAARSVDRTLDILGHIAEASDSLSRAESANRGYLLYGTERLLDERERALKQAHYEAARLRELASDTASQLRRVAALEKLTTEFEAGLRASANDTRQALSKGSAAPRPNLEPTAVSERLYELTTEMKAKEFRRLGGRRAHDEDLHATQFKLLAVLVTVIAFVMFLGYIGHFRASRATRRAEVRMHEIAESLPGAVFQFRKQPNGAGRYEFLSRNTAAVRGVETTEALKDPQVLERTVHEPDRAGLLAGRIASERSMTPLTYDFRVTDPDGAMRWIRGYAAPRLDTDGSILWTGHWGDVTEQKLLAQELLESKEAADAASRAKSIFLATMSHEIRTPMNGVVGMLELLSLSNLDAEQRTTLEIVRESGRSLLRIIDDILDFSRIEAGKLELRPEPTLVASVVERVINIYAGNASSKGLVLRRSVDRTLDAPLLVDPLRLQQILNNFVSNAIKFTPKGEVVVTVERVGRHDGKDHVRFSVKDTGIGISAAEKERLFQPFSQASEETTARYGGSGLGLSICGRLAALMGGSIEMHSQVGQGTTLVLNLSLPVVEAKIAGVLAAPAAAQTNVVRRDAPSVAQAEQDGTLILLVDDHPINRMVLLKQLKVLGYAAVAAEDGLEALALWSHGRFGAVITDCNMPEMTGYDLARRIRDRELRNGRRRIPIIACTANALGGEAQNCFEAGMDDYLAKPVELPRLAEKLAAWLPLPTAPSGEIDRPPHESKESCADPIDAAILDEIADGDDALAREILDRFHRHNQEDVAQLRGAVGRVDAEAVAFAAHRIKGSGNTVGARALAEVCDRLEKAGNSRDWTAIAENMGAFDRENARLDAYLESNQQQRAS